AAGEGIGGAGADGRAGADGGQYFAQFEKSAGIDQDDFAGADGECGDAGVVEGGNADGVGEVSRLSNKLRQLLQFSRPAILGGAAALCDVGEIVNEVSSVMKH